MNRPNLTRGWTLYERLVFALIVLEVAHIVILFNDSSFPLPLLYGPLFWSLYTFFVGNRSLKVIKYLFVYSIPFVLFAVWNLLLGSEITWTYYKWYLPIMVPIQIVFPVLILLKMRSFPRASEKAMLIKQQMALGIGISVFVATLFLKHYMNFNFEMNIDPIYAIVVALCFSVGIMINYLYAYYRNYNNEVQLLTSNKERSNFEIEESILKNCAMLLNKAMEGDKLYLDPRLSLDRLSAHVSVPKTIISNYLRHILGYSYYEWLATYRINHAVQLLEDESLDYKLEAIAYASGFSSKTTFNRYFKDIVGILPSLYRNKTTS
ncbi:AraC-type DNA-binding protein [Sphingobacterium nematocida]|uniref:AraC-type DNA-binding protein n=1 Tax=Sphingobacterium nematocida TaxID=1513896 RepID=A0A1T5BRN0_9SPHI|nr:helix-turn-helix domain-containing protein [Sphingobacterium nematocida]SKB49896.1 AraC-type DNA-binding protein [Sphingobacterium nematocida]